jgi:MFS family permease
MFWVGIRLRERYWLPTPASIRISTAPYSPKTGFLGRLGFSSAESAIFKKDLRSLTRRREMARLLAIPVIILVSMLASFTSSAGSRLEFLAFSLLSFSLAVAIFSLVISMISIGQEASAIWNIYSSPIAPKEIVKAKLILGFLISLGVLLIIFLVVSLLFRPGYQVLMLFFFLGLSLAIAETSVGLMIGSRFPDFSEIPRSRFVTFSGGFVGTVAGLIVGGIVGAPAFIYTSVGQIFQSSEYSLAAVTVLTILLGVAFSLVAYKLSVIKISELLEELPA